MTIEKLTQLLNKIPNEGAVNKARRMAIIRMILELQQEAEA
jgi:hypothetical protein